MAGAFVGEAFLSATFQVLCQKIASREFCDFFQKKKLNLSLLTDLRITLLSLRAVLNDAEDKQISSPSIREWLDELTDAIYDAEDLLDEISTDALRCVAEPRKKPVSDKLRNFLSSSFSSGFHNRMNGKMEELLRILKLFAQEKDVLGLKEGIGGRVSRRTPTTSLVDQSAVYGRDGDKEKLVNYLLREDGGGENGIGVIAILGMGGIGKTTLAQLLYNEENVKEHFDMKVWVCISEDFDVTMITKTLLESVTSETYASNHLDFLKVELRQSLTDKRFLFVLDDLWNDNYSDWEDLKSPFSSGKKGSRVVITTRQRRVAEVTNTFPIHELGLLSQEDCWLLLAKHAFGNITDDLHHELEVIGRKIAEKSGGLPIAVKTLAGLLRSKPDAKEWYNVLTSNIWDFPNNDVLPALRLSYHYLPAHLKRCFAYCSIFPKGYSFNKKIIILLWMAESLVQQPKGVKTLEEIGNKYFDELLSRSLIHQVKENVEEFIIHDLVHDLAKVVSRKTSFRFEGSEIPGKVRHISYHRGNYDSSNKFEFCHELKHLRTFLALPIIEKSSTERHYLTERVLNDYLPTMHCLRVLSLSHYDNISRLPASIGNLIHLRFLDLSYTAIKILPNEICALYNLQTLMLSNCRSLSKLPSNIGNLINLSHLHIDGTDLKEMPVQMSRLQNLQTLSTFIVGKHWHGLRVRELRNLQHLQGKLSILKLKNVVDSSDAHQADLKNKVNIKELVLDWGDNPEASQIESDVLDKLQPSTSLKSLTIQFYGGTSFPSWLADGLYSNIVFLCISDCNYCSSLPPLGQLPLLKVLLIKRMRVITTVGEEFYGHSCSPIQPFPTLRSLTFEDMSGWEEWLPFSGMASEFPSLQLLRLISCPNLRGNLPNHIPLLRRLEISGCHQLELHNPPWMSTIQVLKVEGPPVLQLSLDARSNSSLQYLCIERCDAIEFSPRMILRSNCLRYLCLLDISCFMSFPRDGLSTSLVSLYISNCDKLEFLPHETMCNYKFLEWLTIYDSCSSLEFFHLGCFPVLRGVSIRGCVNLKSLPITETSHGSLSHLEILRVAECPNLESFPPCQLPTPNLTEFTIVHCKNLKSLPEHIDSLTALKELKISKLPSLVSIAEGGLPPNLQNFFVYSCKKLMPTADWGLQKLNYLQNLLVGGDDIFNTVMKEQLLPSCLLSFIIFFDLPHLKSFDGKGLQHVSSLEMLEILKCPSLESLPEEKLPSSLSTLRIEGCPQLEARCQRWRKKDWSKISDIPCININDEVIIWARK